MTKPKPRPGRCVECGRRVDPLTVVSHVLRGSHTCRDVDGIVPPYADPESPDEHAATETARDVRLSKRH